MPVHQIGIDTHRPLTAMKDQLAAVALVVAIVTAIQETIMTQEENMTPVVITVRGMVILHRVTAVPVVVESWTKMLTDQEV